MPVPHKPGPSNIESLGPGVSIEACGKPCPFLLRLSYFCLKGQGVEYILALEHGASRKHERDDVAYELLPLEFLFPGRGIVEPVAGYVVFRLIIPYPPGWSLVSMV